MSEIKISIIVPVYNVEKYLKKSLDSILDQTLTDIEIICVNDGSTDKSVKILEQYEKKDSRIVVLHKENGGLSSARNAGMKIAKGEYLAFVDSDDWVDKTMFEKMYNNAKYHGSQLVFCAVHLYDDNTRKCLYNDPYFTLESFKPELENRVFNHFDTIDFLMDVSVMAWNKIYLREFIQDNHLEFPDGLIFEDGPFFFQSFFKMDKVTFVNEFLYYYRINRPNSIVKKGGKNYIDIFDVVTIMWNELKKQPYFNQVKCAFIKKKFDDISYRFKFIDKRYKELYYSKFRDFEPFKELSEEEISKIGSEYPYIIEWMDCLRERDYKSYLKRTAKLSFKEKFMYKIIEILYNTPEHYTFKFYRIKLVFKKQYKNIFDAWYCDDQLFIVLLKKKFKFKFNFSELETRRK